MAYRKLSAQPQAEADFSEFLEDLQRALTEGQRDPNETVRDTLYQIYFGGTISREARSEASPDFGKLSLAARAVVHSFDPRNITTEPEYYPDIDIRLYSERKPFIWLWQMFDRSPLGQNALLGHQFRRMLAPLIFRRVGNNFKCWPFVEWSFGYNLSFGDDVVVHRHVLLDDAHRMRLLGDADLRARHHRGLAAGEGVGLRDDRFVVRHDGEIAVRHRDGRGAHEQPVRHPGAVDAAIAAACRERKPWPG